MVSDFSSSWRLVKIQPSASVLEELRKNGYTQADILHALSEKPWDEADGDILESPLELYKKAVGYMFNWGHVIEVQGEPFDGVPCYSAQWEFCLDDMLGKTHRGGLHLIDLCDFCDEFFVFEDRSSWPVNWGEGGSMSSFSLYIQSSNENYDSAVKEISAARSWVSAEFMENVFPRLIQYLDSKLSNTVALN